LRNNRVPQPIAVCKAPPRQEQRAEGQLFSQHGQRHTGEAVHFFCTGCKERTQKSLYEVLQSRRGDRTKTISKSSLNLLTRLQKSPSQQRKLRRKLRAELKNSRQQLKILRNLTTILRQHPERTPASAAPYFLSLLSSSQFSRYCFGHRLKQFLVKSSLTLQTLLQRCLKNVSLQCTMCMTQYCLHTCSLQRTESFFGQLCSVSSFFV
jgi:hypothetical protein